MVLAAEQDALCRDPLRSREKESVCARDWPTFAVAVAVAMAINFVYGHVFFAEKLG
jgi:hypothetical protein